MSELAGTQLGQYQITEMICRGGMATVYKAYQPALDRDVAVKVLQRAHDPAFANRFKREARAIARLQHPYILPVYDYGEQSGLLYLVLQYIEGGTTLADLYGEPMEPAPALRMIAHVLGALEYAHQRGVIHRDIKPANILMPSPDWPLLGDFGIAKLVNESGPITQGGLLGTAAYMAPEQAVGRQADVRTDLYAVGVVLYELLTGRTPFDAIDPVALLHQHVYDPLPPPRGVNPSLPVVVEKILLRALAKNPDARYQTAAEMAAELGRVADQLDRTSERGHLLRLYEAGVRAFEAEQWEAAVEQLGALVAHDQDYDDAAELLELARGAQRHTQTSSRLFRPGALRGAARRLQRKGQGQEQAGNLAGALASYKAARAEAALGPARDEAAAAAARLVARMRREKGSVALGPVSCLRCGREVQPEWAGCPYCFAPLNKAPLERELGGSEHPPFTAALPTLATDAPVERPPQPEVDTPPQIMPRATTPLVSARVVEEPPPGRRAADEPLPHPAAPVRPRGRRVRPPWTPLLIALALLGSGGGIIWASQRRSNGAGGAGAAGAIATATLPPTWTRTPVPPPTNTSTSTPTSTPSPTAPPTSTPSPTGTPTAPPTSTLPPTVPPPPPAPVAVSTALLNLRAGPGQEYPALGRYEQGTRFNVLGRNTAGTWLQTQAPDNRIGWLAAQFLQLDGVLSDLPVVEAPRPPQPTARPTARPRPTTRPQPPAPTPPRTEPTPQPQPEPPPQPVPPNPLTPEPTPPPRPEPTEEPPPPPPPPPAPEPTDEPPPPAPEPTDEPPPEPTPPPREPPPPPRP